MAHGNHHKGHNSHVVITFVMLCIHKLQLQGLECKEIYFWYSCINEKATKGKVTFLTFLCTYCAMMICVIWKVSGTEQVPNLR